MTPFLEVFSGIRLDAGIKALAEKIQVSNITMSRTSDLVNIQLSTDLRYISRSDIGRMEDLLLRQFFAKADKRPVLSLRYSWGEGLDDEEIWNRFHIYIEEELDYCSHICSDIYRNASVNFSDGIVSMNVRDNCVAAAKAEQIEKCISDMFREHFGREIRTATIFSRKAEDTEDDYDYSEQLAEYVMAREKKSAGDSTDTKNASAQGQESTGQKETASSKPASEDKSKAASSDSGDRASGRFSDKNYGNSGFGKKNFAYDKARSFTKKALPPDDPDIFYGQSFDGEAINICDIQDSIGDVIIRGKVVKYEARETKSGKLLIMFEVTDFTDTIQVKAFLNDEEKETVPKFIEPDKKPKFIKLKGIAAYDPYSKDITISSVRGMKKISDFRTLRMDNAEHKRIELHAHTKMSDKDGVVDAADLVKTAFRWGHRGIAITDHGVVQSFPEASHAIKPEDYPEGEERERAKAFKIVYGCEAYLVDDEADRVTVEGRNDKITEFVKGPDGKYSDEDILKMPVYHIILLCRNDTGRINLYKLISMSHLQYFARRPRIPKSLLRENREGIIVGSACEAGELFRAIVHNKPEEEVRRIADFYDYYEIQQCGNNAYMIDSPKFPEVTCYEDLKRINKRIVELADHDNKLCVATCDVHFLNPEDEIYRRIIMFANGFDDADKQAPLFLHTTDEMLEECNYLGKEKAYEVVVENTNKIFDMVEKISPVRPDKCPPVIEDSDKTLREICERRAREIYGPNLPEEVEKRLEHELDSIIKNGYAVMYIIAQKLVWKSNEDGYLVGSRGSVGSSFVATMAGITEVNPLPPHYYCNKCHYCDFKSDIVKSYLDSSGFDMPDAVCPQCGEPLVKEGQNIPFETFLGFNCDKEPDIDLNFSNEYQSKAHDYTEVIFGAGQTFKAGTVSSLADKNALKSVYKYYETHGEHKRNAELERIAHGCEGVKVSTGQHPGGIVVLPVGEQIYTFTPVQRPANDVTSTTVTTHFDYHSIDHNLLKLDILGHLDPTMIRMLEDLTGLDAKTIPMDDKKVVSLFASTEALGIKPEDIGGTELGSLGLPELGTAFVMQMLKDTKPKRFSDMVRIAGLSHGTDVWLGNAQEFIKNGDCTLATAICTRDDIMIYLISMGLEPGLAFKTMESVRKGKGLKPEMEQAMIEHGVPDWYIRSCKLIKYMFPKAHATAYMMMAFRIAYFKIYYPLAYYAAYFSIRAADTFDYGKMCLGRQKLDANMAELKHIIEEKKANKQTCNTEEGQLGDMEIVREMYARGFEFMPIDIYKAKTRHFQIFDGKLMPSFRAIPGLGNKAADQMEEAARHGAYISQEDFKNRCKVGDGVIETMRQYGFFGDLPKTNQMSLSDWFNM